jgi:hypothetical protein
LVKHDNKAQPLDIDGHSVPILKRHSETQIQQLLAEKPHQLSEEQKIEQKRIKRALEKQKRRQLKHNSRDTIPESILSASPMCGSIPMDSISAIQEKQIAGTSLNRAERRMLARATAATVDPSAIEPSILPIPASVSAKLTDKVPVKKCEDISCSVDSISLKKSSKKVKLNN